MGGYRHLLLSGNGSTATRPNSAPISMSALGERGVGLIALIGRTRSGPGGPTVRPFTCLSCGLTEKYADM